MNIGTWFVIAGTVQFFAAWTFYRKPGQPFPPNVALWHASRGLDAAGVGLWAGGWLLALVGVVAMIVR